MPEGLGIAFRLLFLFYFGMLSLSSWGLPGRLAHFFNGGGAMLVESYATYIIFIIIVAVAISSWR